MIEYLKFDNESIEDIIGSLAILIDRFNKYHMKRVFNNMKTKVPLMLNNVIRIESHSKFYRVHYTSNVLLLDSRTARVYYDEYRIVNFVRVNKNNIVNLAYIDYVDSSYCCHFKYSKDTVKMSELYLKKI
jgi:DNA-binding LytR/AlgR family response regulator